MYIIFLQFKILVPKLDYLMGRMIQVEIIECTKHSMKGRVIEESLSNYPKRIQVKKGQVTGLVNSDLNNNAKFSTECCGNDGSNIENSCATSCCSSVEVGNKLYDFKHNRIREYAIATLIASGVILLSKIALRYLNSK